MQDNQTGEQKQIDRCRSLEVQTPSQMRCRQRAERDKWNSRRTDRKQLTSGISRDCVSVIRGWTDGTIATWKGICIAARGSGEIWLVSRIYISSRVTSNAQKNPPPSPFTTTSSHPQNKVEPQIYGLSGGATRICGREMEPHKYKRLVFIKCL